jgi:hypothetical protein
MPTALLRVLRGFEILRVIIRWGVAPRCGEVSVKTGLVRMPMSGRLWVLAPASTIPRSATGPRHEPALEECDLVMANVGSSLMRPMRCSDVCQPRGAGHGAGDFAQRVPCTHSKVRVGCLNEEL